MGQTEGLLDKREQIRMGEDGTDRGTEGKADRRMVELGSDRRDGRR